MRCWCCGIEPDGEYEVMSMESESPPSADHLAEQGHVVLMKICETLW